MPSMDEQIQAALDSGDMSTASWEVLLEIDRRMYAEIESLKSAANVARSEMMERLKQEKRDSKIVAGHTINIRARFNFRDVPMSFADGVGATKVSMDTGRLKELYTRGVSIPNLRITKYLHVREMTKDS